MGKSTKCKYEGILIKYLKFNILVRNDQKFWNIWANPQTKIHGIVKYLLMMTDTASLTWTAHLKIIFKLYNLPDPIELMNGPLWSKERWKSLTETLITAYHESVWRQKAEHNSKLEFLHVQGTGLSGRPHPVLSGVLTTQDVVRARVHIKMLAGDYPCYFNMGSDRKQDSFCPLCRFISPDQPSPTEDMVHLLTRCRGTQDTRTRILPDLLNTIALLFPTNDILQYPNHTQLAQLILDPTSLNLPTTIRIGPDHPALPQVLSNCRNLCYALHKDRTRQLKILKSRN